MSKNALLPLMSKISNYWSAFTLRLSYGHGTFTAARLAYLEVN